MKTVGRVVIAGIAERLGVQATKPRNTLTGKTAQAYLLRDVASDGVELREVASPSVELHSVELNSVEFLSVELPSVEVPSVSHRVASLSVCRRALPAPKPAISSPRLELAHVFACLKTAAAKSRVSRLVSRFARQSMKKQNSASIPSASVASASVGCVTLRPGFASASRLSHPNPVPRSRLH